MEIKVDGVNIGDNHPIFIIAEAGDNHMGNMVDAREMCLRAKLAGASAIKFQHHLPYEEMLRDVPRVSNTEIETNKPNQRRSYLINAAKYAPVNARAPVMENSYMFPQGTRPAEMPRVTTPKNKRMNPKIIIAVATRATFSVRL